MWLQDHIHTTLTANLRLFGINQNSRFDRPVGQHRFSAPHRHFLCQLFMPSPPGTPVVSFWGNKELLMIALAQTFFTERKMKIALLTLATFAALC